MMALLKILSSPYCPSATPFNVCISVTDYNSDGIVLGGGDVNVLISAQLGGQIFVWDYVHMECRHV